VTSASVGTARIGKPVLLTVNGSNLDRGLTVASPGCASVSLSTTAPNISTATTAYFTCTASAPGAQQFTVTRTADSTLLNTVAYTVAIAQVSGTPTTGAARLGQSVLLTVNGSDLDLGLNVTSAGCSSVALSTSAPNVSSASTAYFSCTASAVGAQQFVVARGSDSAVLSTVPYTVTVAQIPDPSTASTSTPKYTQPLVLTLQGTDLDLGLTVTSPGCTNPTLSTTAPNISTATTAYFTCTVSALGSQQLTVKRNNDNAVLATVPFTVPQPQVTMTISNGVTGGFNGTMVVTLEAALAPVTVRNFLSYVSSGFYVGTIIHRYVPGFVLQGGGYPGPVTATAPTTHKPTNAPIVLETNVGLSNLKWTLAMARTSDPNSATSEYFINVVNNNGTIVGGNNLDYISAANPGYAVFGTITTGTEVVTSMTAAPCVATTFLSVGECLPLPNLTITSISQTR
jgi:peptidyl-prolyl cis-trans isomerase A (cyclophilin A)